MPAILVTGGAGYIGSQLVRDLAKDPRFEDCVIRIYDNLQRHHVYGLLDLPSVGRFEFIEGDILDRASVERAMEGAAAVIHLAAIVRTPLSFDHPEWTEQVNHWGTASVLGAALEKGLSQFLHVSSAVVYGPGGPFTEEDECRPVGPYAESKWKAEREVVEAAKRGLRTCIVRLGIVYGNAPAVRFDAFVNRFAYLAGIGRPIVIHGSGDQVRPIIHIKDVSSVLRDRLVQMHGGPQIINAVTSNTTVIEVAELLQQLAPPTNRWYTSQDVLTEISFNVSGEQLNSLGFRPSFGLKQGLVEMLGRLKSISRIRRSESMITD